MDITPEPSWIKNPVQSGYRAQGARSGRNSMDGARPTCGASLRPRGAGRTSVKMSVTESMLTMLCILLKLMIDGFANFTSKRRRISSDQSWRRRSQVAGAWDIGEAAQCLPSVSIKHFFVASVAMLLPRCTGYRAGVVALDHSAEWSVPVPSTKSYATLVSN